MAITDLTGYTWKDIHITNNFLSEYFSLNTRINGVDYSHVYTDNDDINPQDYMWSITFYNSNPTESNAVTFGYPESYSEQVEIIGGADATNETLISYLELYGTLTPPSSNITLDLSTLSLPEGTHSIQMALSDDGYTKRDSEKSNAVTYEVSSWIFPVQTGDDLLIQQAYSATQTNDNLEVL